MAILVDAWRRPDVLGFLESQLSARLFRQPQAATIISMGHKKLTVALVGNQHPVST